MVADLSFNGRTQVRRYQKKYFHIRGKEGAAGSHIYKADRE
jgi:hypothetical protein